MTNTPMSKEELERAEDVIERGLEALNPAMSRADFDADEAIVRANLNSFIEAGQALARIHDGRGYRYLEYLSFGAYLIDRWEISRFYAHRLMKAAGIAEQLPIGNMPTNEAQLRELAPLRDDPDALRGAWQEAIETAPNGRVTAAHVAAVVERRTPRPLREVGSTVAIPRPLLRFMQADLPTAAIVTLILRVFFPDARTALDSTYGSGLFWDGSAHVEVTAHDIDPERAPHGVMDATALTYADDAFDVCVFDPPHLPDAGAASVMGQRFGTGDLKEVRRVIVEGTREAWRVARLGVVCKITDHIHGQQFQPESDWVREAIGGRAPYDVVHQTRSSSFSDPKWGEQYSADNNGSTFLIFRKGDQRHVKR